MVCDLLKVKFNTNQKFSIKLVFWLFTDGKIYY